MFAPPKKTKLIRRQSETAAETDVDLIPKHILKNGNVGHIKAWSNYMELLKLYGIVLG